MDIPAGDIPLLIEQWKKASQSGSGGHDDEFKTRPELESLMKKIAALKWSGYKTPQLPGMRRWKEHGFFYLERLRIP